MLALLTVSLINSFWGDFFMYRDIMAGIDKIWLLRKLFIKRKMGGRIYFQQLSMLRYIYEHPDCTQKDIAKHFYISSATVAVSTKKLQKAELIQKTVQENNLRCKHLSLTEKGRNEILRIENIFRDYDKNIVFKGFSSDELDSLKSSLEKLSRNMESAEGICYSDNPDEVIAQIMEKLCGDSDK